MYRYKLTIEYNGSGFYGWQRQKECKSVQNTIESAINKFTGELVQLTAAGRTDKGVHAIAMVAHLDLNQKWDEYTILQASNFHLRNQSITITKVESVDSSFHARFSAKERIYQYLILNRLAPSALMEGRAWHIPQTTLNIQAMRDATGYLIGEHDFSSFRSSICQSNSPIKTINYLNIVSDRDLIKFEVSAKSFLHHMVRNLVGALAYVGIGKLKASDIKEILEARDRTIAPPTAPACGLYFMEVKYN